MSTAVSAAWQHFGLGLHASPSGQAAFSTLRTVIGAPRRSKHAVKHFSSRCRVRQWYWGKLVTYHHLGPAQTTRPILHQLGKQPRWVSLWRPLPEEEEAQGEMTAENEISISPAKVEKIFGRKIDPEKGIEILMMLQKHRLEGTLDYKMPYSAPLLARGLAWLRKTNPIDEDAAIIARIDRETIGTRTPQTNVEHSRQAVSQFDKMRDENKKRNEIEQEKRDVEEKAQMEKSSRETLKKIEIGGNRQTSPSNELVGLRPEPDWVRRYREKATGHDESVKLLSTWQRLVPSAAVTLTVVTLSILFAANYTPPSRSARIWPEIPPAAATIFALIGINCAVFMFWRIPPLWKFMNKTFLVAPVYPYARSMLGAPFSHQQFGHLFANCFSLWLLGTRIHDDIGRGPFLAAYFSCAVIGAFLPMAVYALRKNLVATTLGASAAICGLVATGCVIREGTTITLPFIPPEWTRGIDTGLLLVLLMVSEILSIRKWGITPSLHPGAIRPHIDNMGHLAGYLAGVGAGVVIRSTHPKWKNTERHHFFSATFGKSKEPPLPKKSPTE